MDTSLSAVLDLYVFPTGRRLFALGRVHAAAKAAGFTDLAKHCRSAITHDQACLALERRWAGVVAASRGKSASPPAGALDATRIDPLLDRTLTAMRDHAESQRAGAPANDPIHATVTAFLEEVFPGGLQEVTNLPYVEELVAVDHILGRLKEKSPPKGKSLVPMVEELGLGRIVKRLGQLAEQYRAALEAPAPETIEFGKVRAARAEGQGMLLQAVAIILGKHHRGTAEDVAARAALLGPILEQNEAIAAAMKARRTVEDVNPESGEPDPNATAAPAAPAPDAPKDA